MIDEMVTLLGEEQGDDDAKKQYCESALDKSEDEKKVLEQSLADLEKSIADAKETIATLAEEIAALLAGIKARLPPPPQSSSVVESADAGGHALRISRCARFGHPCSASYVARSHVALRCSRVS